MMTCMCVCASPALAPPFAGRADGAAPRGGAGQRRVRPAPPHPRRLGRHAGWPETRFSGWEQRAREKRRSGLAGFNSQAEAAVRCGLDGFIQGRRTWPTRCGRRQRRALLQAGARTRKGRPFWVRFLGILRVEWGGSAAARGTGWKGEDKEEQYLCGDGAVSSRYGGRTLR